MPQDNLAPASKESWTEPHIDIDRMEEAGAGVPAAGTLTGTSRDSGARRELEAD